MLASGAPVQRGSLAPGSRRARFELGRQRVNWVEIGAVRMITPGIKRGGSKSLSGLSPSITDIVVGNAAR